MYGQLGQRSRKATTYHIEELGVFLARLNVIPIMQESIHASGKRDIGVWKFYSQYKTRYTRTNLK